MTTATWSSRLRHDSDATYQEWRDEFITKLGLMVAAGKLAADETNITPGAGARPGTNTEQGYAVYHISDTMHGTAPIYIRFGFGTGSGVTVPRLRWTIGTATNGSGVLSGTCLTSITDMYNSGSVGESTDTVRTSYLCVTAGFFGLQWKIHTANNFDSFNCIARSVDNTGAITATGALYLITANNNASASAVQVRHARFAATAALYGTGGNLSPAQGMIGFFPSGAAISTLVGSDIQACLCWLWTPQVLPLLGICGVLPLEVGVGVTFSATLVGTAPHTYIGLGVNYGGPGPDTASGSNGWPKFAMLWE